MTLYDQIRPIIRRVGEDKVWRPIYNRSNQMLYAGVGENDDILRSALRALDFSNCTVVDLGCNFGYYTFQAARLGACRVVGIDTDADMIRGCRLLATNYGIPDAEFRRFDFMQDDLDETFDIAMLVDFIGKEIIRKNRLISCLSAAAACSHNIFFLSLRPKYRIRKSLKVSEAELAEMYGADTVKGGHFDQIELVKRLFAPGWHLYLPDEAWNPDQKYPVVAVRKAR